MSEELEVVAYSTRTDFAIKLYVGEDISRCRAVLFTGKTEQEAEELYDRINIALGHTERDQFGDLRVLSTNGPYVLID